jgi:HSP20 family protein
MDLIKWTETPFDRLERVFLDTMNSNLRPARHISKIEDVYIPNLDISEDKENFYVIAELPGLAENNVKVTVDDNVLTISGQKEQKEEKKDRNYHRVERSFGEFTRSLSLPKNVIAGAINGTFKDGLLEITMPKTVAVVPAAREITLNSASTASATMPMKPNGQLKSNGKAVLA